MGVCIEDQTFAYRRAPPIKELLLQADVDQRHCSIPCQYTLHANHVDINS